MAASAPAPASVELAEGDDEFAFLDEEYEEAMREETARRRFRGNNQ